MMIVLTTHVASMEHVLMEMDLEIILATVQMASVRAHPWEVAKVRRQASTKHIKTKVEWLLICLLRSLSTLRRLHLLKYTSSYLHHFFGAAILTYMFKKISVLVSIVFFITQ